MRSTYFTVALLAGLAVGAPAHAAPTTHHTHAARAALSQQDRDFLRQAAGSGHAEVLAGELALHSSDQGVRDFGQRLVHDHSAANGKLDRIALDLHVTPPSRPLPPQQAQIRNLRALHGQAFDRAFIDQAGVSDHEQAIALFTREADSANAAPALREFAQQTLPTLQEHLRIAQNLQARAEPDGGRNTASAGSHRNGGEQADAQQEVQKAVQVVHRMKSDPNVASLLARAKGVFILPDYGRAALGVGVQGGEGVLVTRHGGQFSDPAFYNMGGVSIGAQAGASGGEVAFLLMSDRAVQTFRSNRHFSLNADAGLTIVAYSARGEASGGKVQDVVVWSGTRGAYAGASVAVTDVVADKAANRSYYGKPDVTPTQILAGDVKNPHDNLLGMVLAV